MLKHFLEDFSIVPRLASARLYIQSIVHSASRGGRLGNLREQGSGQYEFSQRQERHTVASCRSASSLRKLQESGVMLRYHWPGARWENNSHTAASTPLSLAEKHSHLCVVSRSLKKARWKLKGCLVEATGLQPRRGSKEGSRGKES